MPDVFVDNRVGELLEPEGEPTRGQPTGPKAPKPWGWVVLSAVLLALFLWTLL